jgi:hypothetical protein
LSNQISPLKFRFEIILLLFIFATTAILQWPYLFEFPGYIHGWAQVDRYALSMGFLRNGFDLLHPETFVYNPIYPGDFLIQSTSTISAIDFPLHDYFVALWMKITGVQSPWLFRVYVILMGCVGLYYLGKLARLILEDEVKALFVVAFAAFSPVFVYYQGSLLPSVPSLALSIVGVYHYFVFRAGREVKHLHVSMVFLGVALLSRTTFVIPFIAILGMEFLSIVKERKIEWKRYIVVLPIVVIFFLYRWHNDALRNEFGSMFLHRLIPAESREEAWFLLNYIWEHWRLAYFSSAHYWAISAVLVVVVVCFFAKKLNTQSGNLLISYSGIYVLGCLLFAAAMLKQFQDHDYYFLDTFYLPCILLVIALLSFLPKAINKMHRAIYLAVFAAFVGFAFKMPIKSQRSRHEAGTNNRLQNTIENFTGSAEYLDALGVPRNATMLVVDAVAPNMPLTLMDRKGLVVMWSVKGMIEHAFKWDFDYIVFQNEYFQDQVYRDYPEVLTRVRKLGSNGRITVCARDEGNGQTLQEFLGLTGKPTLEENVDFESGDSGRWKGYKTTSDTAHSSARAAYFTRENSSGLTMEWSNLACLKEAYHPATVSLWVKTDEAINADLVVWMSSDGREVLHEIRSLKDRIKPASNWQNIEYSFVLPEAVGEDSRLSVYLVNRSLSLMYYDDVRFAVYP